MTRHGSCGWLDRMFIRAVAALAIAYTLLTAGRVYARSYYLFLPDYFRWTMTPAPPVSGPRHLFVLMTDHWEPDKDAVKARRWADGYVALASRHRDHDDRAPQHTWFYHGEQATPEVLAILKDLTTRGFGEVELHYHHARDTEATMRDKLQRAIDAFQQFGFLKTVDGRTKFAFVHGNFDLDNAIGQYCGVDSELKLLRELGCFADFSFPSVYRQSQPDIVNAIYAAKDDAAPKSYAHRLPLDRLSDGSADLMMFQGPLVFAPSLNAKRLFLDLDDANIHRAMPASPERIPHWVRANVHVDGRPDWVFIKLWGHGVSSPDDEEAVIGSGFDAMLTAFEREYNDGRRYVLHYVSAREAFNLAMAAARRAQGEPQQYFDAEIPPYVASAARKVN